MTLNSHPPGVKRGITIEGYYKAPYEILQSIHHRTLTIAHTTTQQNAEFRRRLSEQSGNLGYVALKFVTITKSIATFFNLDSQGSLNI